MKLTAILLLFVSAAGAFYLYSRPEAYPYASSSAETRITMLANASAGDPRAFFRIESGDIKGEAVLTSVAGAGEGKAIVESELFSARSAFADRPAPYPGHVTSRIECTARKFAREEPLPFGGTETRLVLAVAGPRGIVGSCLVNHVKFASASWTAFDARRGQVVSIKLLKPVSEVSQVREAQNDLVRIFREVTGH